MKYIFLICVIPTIICSSFYDIIIDSDDDCWSNEKNNTMIKSHASLIQFSPKVAYGKESCSIHMTHPWLTNIQNGFGLFVPRPIDCSSTIKIDCLPDSILFSQTIPTSVQFTCHTSENNIQMPCSAISITFKRNIKNQAKKKTTNVQVVALAKAPCIDDDLFFRCWNDYSNSCLDRDLLCNGRSECPSGGDEHNCHPVRSAGISMLVIILIVLACLFLVCVLSTVLICCCCRAACNGIIRRFRSMKGNTSAKKGDITITGEDAGLMKGLTAPTTVVEILPQQCTEPAPLFIDSTKPIYPRLE